MIEVILLNACHSEHLGNKLVENKIAKYVICFDKDEWLVENLALTFSSIFWSFVMQGENI